MVLWAGVFKKFSYDTFTLNTHNFISRIEYIKIIFDYYIIDFIEYLFYDFIFKLIFIYLQAFFNSVIIHYWYQNN